jgi:hypothetical protein
MRLRSLLLWVVGLGLLGGLLFSLHLVHGLMKAERAREGEGETVQSPQRVKEGVVEIGKEAARRYGLKEAPARAVSWHERVPAYGRVVPNPGATVEVRSPFAGTLRAGEAPWPAPGRWVKAGQTLGWVDVRVDPGVVVDLQNKLSEARSREKGAREEVKLQQSRVASLKAVTGQQILARTELDAALVQLAQARTQLATARAAAELWRKALQEVEQRGKRKSSAWSAPLRVPADGEVTELAGRPGMAIEAGALVAQAVDPRKPLVRLDVPQEVLARQGPPSQVELVAAGGAGEATLVGPAPRLDVASQLAGYWYEVKPPASSAPWRPGLYVKAYLRSPDSRPRPAVSVPASAVLYHQGRALVYVEVEPGEYQRREVTPLGREGDRWVLARRREPVGVAPGERVVYRQAQLLLSEEFRGTPRDND